MNDDIRFKNELEAMEFIYEALGDIAYINNVTPSSPIVRELNSIAGCLEGVENELSRMPTPWKR